MAAAWLLTLLALGGVIAGVYLGRTRLEGGEFSHHLAAAGGGLLFGVALFWLMPEIAETAGWRQASLIALVAAAGLAIFNKTLVHMGHSPRHGVLGPLLAATAIHSLLDGWSVRALGAQPITGIAVPIGLALHKIPEGLALGWLTRRSFSSHWRAATAAGGAELFTLLGAFLEPGVDRSGAAKFGDWWTAAVLAVIAGAFLFLGFHAVLPHWRVRRVWVLFLTTLALVGSAGVVRLLRG